jgi:hypothetical protein
MTDGMGAFPSIPQRCWRGHGIAQPSGPDADPTVGCPSPETNPSPYRQRTPAYINAVRRHLGYRSEYRSPFSSGDILIFGLAYKSSLFEKFSICADGALGLGQSSLLYNGILPKDTNMESKNNSGARPTCSALPHANKAPRRGNSCTSTVRPVSF